MQKILYFGLVIATIFVTSCRKYEEGPNVSLRSKKARITNNWRVESASLNGIDVSLEPYWAKQKHYMYRNNTYVLTIIDPQSLEIKNLTGKWALYDHDTKLALTTKYNSTVIDTTENFNILKLYNNQLWIRKSDNSLELHLAPAE